VITRSTPGVLLPPDHRHEFKILIHISTQGKKVTCLLKPGMKTGKNHSLNDVNFI
jgi:hypothetical protein